MARKQLLLLIALFTNAGGHPIVRELNFSIPIQSPNLLNKDHDELSQWSTCTKECGNGIKEKDGLSRRCILKQCKGIIQNMYSNFFARTEER